MMRNIQRAVCLIALVSLCFPVSAGLLSDIVMACTFKMRRISAPTAPYPSEVIGDGLRLGPDGRSLNWCIPEDETCQEYRWEIQDETLIMYDKQYDKATTRFDTAKVKQSNGRLLLYGKYIPISGITHELECHQ